MGADQDAQDGGITTQELIDGMLKAAKRLRDGLTVLNILDSTAAAWPGVQQAASDLEVLLQLALNRTRELDARCSGLEGRGARLEARHAADSRELQAAHAAKSKLQEQLDAVRCEAAETERQLTTAAARTEGQLREELARTERALRARADALLSEVEQSKAAAEDARSEALDHERRCAALAAEAERLEAQLEFAEGEAARLKASNVQQAGALAAVREELVAQAAEAEHAGRALEEARQQVARGRAEADAGQAQLRQLVGEQAAARRERQRLEKEVARLQEEGSASASALSQALAEVARLREWQDIFKRCEADKLQEALQRLATAQQQHHERSGARHQQISGLQDQVAAAMDDSRAKACELQGLQKQAGMLSVQLRSAEQGRLAAEAEAGEASARAQALSRQLVDAQLLLECSRAERLTAGAAAREAASADLAELHAQLEAASKEAAVQKVVADAWMRDAKVANERAAACDTRALAAERSLDAVRLQLERDRGGQAGGSAAAELAERELSALRRQLEATAHAHRAQLESQAASFAAELARSRAEAGCEQRQLQAATVQALQSAAPAGLAGRLAAAAAAEVSPRRATAQLPVEEQLRENEKRRPPAHTVRLAAANSRAAFR